MAASPWHFLICSGVHSRGVPFNFLGCSHPFVFFAGRITVSSFVLSCTARPFLFGFQLSSYSKCLSYDLTQSLVLYRRK